MAANFIQDCLTAIKQISRSWVRFIAPGVAQWRLIRVATADEKELRLLPALAPRDGFCIDVGANNGLYLHYLLPLTKNVVAFEPVPPSQAWLGRIFGKRIQLMPYALSDRAGQFEIRYPKGRFPLATLSASNALEGTNSQIRSFPIETRTLDSFGFQNVSFIKIDVEGHEEAVLAGAAATIASSRPNVLVEVEERHSPGSTARVASLFASFDYAGAFAERDTIRDISEFDVARDQNPDNVGVDGKTSRYINNFIFFPREKAATTLAQLHSLISGAPSTG